MSMNISNRRSFLHGLSLLGAATAVPVASAMSATPSSQLDRLIAAYEVENGKLAFLSEKWDSIYNGQLRYCRKNGVTGAPSELLPLLSKDQAEAYIRRADLYDQIVALVPKTIEDAQRRARTIAQRAEIIGDAQPGFLALAFGQAA
jgi:hypothetical protein